MNSWNFNEVTQSDLYDFKACKHNQTGKIYGIKEDATCQSGKEIKKEDLVALSKKANAGDEKAYEQLMKIKSEEKKVRDKVKAEKEAAKKKKEEEGKKKGKGKGKKGGGKGKGKGGKGKKGGGKGKGGKGGGKAAQPAAKKTAQNTQKSQAQTRQRQVESARKGVKALQDALASIKNPKQRARIEEKIADLLTQVAQLSMPNMQPGQAQQVAQGQTPQAPAQGQQQQDKA